MSSRTLHTKTPQECPSLTLSDPWTNPTEHGALYTMNHWRIQFKSRYFDKVTGHHTKSLRFPRTLQPSSHSFDVHGSVHPNTNLIEMSNKMQLCRTIYYSIVPWLLNMFRATSLIIRSFWTVIRASGFTHVCRCRPLSWLSGNLQFGSSWWWATVSLETYWSVKEQFNNKLSYTDASCWSFL